MLPERDGPKIVKLAPYRFSVTYDGGDPLLLNFQPLATAAMELCRCDAFVLKHWQARPRGKRRFGLFEWVSGNTSYAAHKGAVRTAANHYDLQIPEGDYVPSAALFYPNSRASGSKVVPHIVHLRSVG